MKSERRASEWPLPSVPRSKGCINCVSRKTRCDGRRPTCKACEGRKQKCRGYRRDNVVFMSDGWRAPGVAASPLPAPKIQHRRRPDGLEARQVPLASRQPSKNEDAEIISRAFGDYQSTIVPLRRLTPEPMAIYVSFFLSQFTPDPPRPTLVLIQNVRQYFGQLLDRPHKHAHPVTNAAEALVKTYFGRLHGSDLLIHESIRSYIRALKSLSLKLDAVQSVGLASLEEDEWMRLVFSCLFLTFWELAMHPNGTTWQKHARGLANLVEGRGPQGFRSPSNLELISGLRMLILLESISSKRPTFLSRRDWQSFRNFTWPGSSAIAAHSILQSVELGGPKHFLDYFIDELVTISNLTADFAELRDTRGPARCTVKTQAALSESLVVLQRLETVLAHLQAEINLAPLLAPSRQGLLRPILSDALLTLQLSPASSRSDDILPPTTKDQPLKYNLTSLCRTAAMRLRLFMCDLINQQDGNVYSDLYRLQQLQEHRAALMVHAEAVLQTIPYCSRSEIFDVAPMCFVPAFRMAEAVLARECDALQKESRAGSEEELERCHFMRDLVRCHLEFAASRKICVKIDV